MKPTSAALSLVFFFGGAAAFGAETAEASAQFSLRNSTYVPAAATRPEARTKEHVSAPAENRLEVSARALPHSAASEQTAALAVRESQPKLIQPIQSQRPMMAARPAIFSPGRNVTIVPHSLAQTAPMAARYQDGIRSATIIRPSAGAAAEKPGLLTRLNRFVSPRAHSTPSTTPVVTVGTAGSILP